MNFHVVYSMPEANIYAGPGKPDDEKFNTFEEARAAAIADLEHWQGKLEDNLIELRKARSIADLPYTKK